MTYLSVAREVPSVAASRLSHSLDNQKSTGFKDRCLLHGQLCTRLYKREQSIPDGRYYPRLPLCFTVDAARVIYHGDGWIQPVSGLYRNGASAILRRRLAASSLSPLSGLDPAPNPTASETSTIPRRSLRLTSPTPPLYHSALLQRRACIVKRVWPVE